MELGSLGSLVLFESGKALVEALLTIIESQFLELPDSFQQLLESRVKKLSELALRPIESLVNNRTCHCFSSSLRLIRGSGQFVWKENVIYRSRFA